MPASVSRVLFGMTQPAPRMAPRASAVLRTESSDRCASSTAGCICRRSVRRASTPSPSSSTPRAHFRQGRWRSSGLRCGRSRASSSRNASSSFRSMPRCRTLPNTPPPTGRTRSRSGAGRHRLPSGRRLAGTTRHPARRLPLPHRHAVFELPRNRAGFRSRVVQLRRAARRLEPRTPGRAHRHHDVMSYQPRRRRAGPRDGRSEPAMRVDMCHRAYYGLP